MGKRVAAESRNISFDFWVLILAVSDISVNLL
jgi:hypothetical protein